MPPPPALLYGPIPSVPVFCRQGCIFLKFPVRAGAQGSLCVGRAFGPSHRPHVAGGSADFCSRVFSCSAALGPFRRASLHAISRGSDDFGPMGKALFVLFAVFAPLLGQGAGEPYFTGRGGPFLHAPARTNYPSPPNVRAWRALWRRRWGAVFFQALAPSGSEGEFTRYFTRGR